jgi:hypothetical protein
LTALHNAPAGYKVESRIYQFATPAPRKPTPTPTPFTPPQTPVAGAPQITLAPVFNIDGTKSTREQVKQIATELRKVVTETLGSNADVSEGWGLLA